MGIKSRISIVHRHKLGVVCLVRAYALGCEGFSPDEHSRLNRR